MMSCRQFAFSDAAPQRVCFSFRILPLSAGRRPHTAPLCGRSSEHWSTKHRPLIIRRSVVNCRRRTYWSARIGRACHMHVTLAANMTHPPLIFDASFLPVICPHHLHHHQPQHQRHGWVIGSSPRLVTHRFPPPVKLIPREQWRQLI